MKFLLDENFPKAAVEFLQKAGHEVFDFRGTADQGMKDKAVFEMAQRHRAVLLTTDRDFFHTIPHLFETHFGSWSSLSGNPTEAPSLHVCNGCWVV